VVVLGLAGCGRSELFWPKDGGADPPARRDAGDASDAGLPFDAGEPIDAGELTDAGGPWWFQFHSASGVQLGAVAVDSSDRVIAAGTGASDVTLGSTPTGAGTLFLATFASDGTPLWSRRFGSAGAGGNVTALATDANGTLFLTGRYDGPTFDFGSLHASNTDGAKGVYVVAVSSAGTPLWLWSPVVGGLGGALAIDGAGRVVAALQESSSLKVIILSAAGAVLAQWTSPGSFETYKEDTPAARAVTLDSAGRILVGGTVWAGTTFFNPPLPPSLYEEGFLAAFDGSSAALLGIKIFVTSNGSGITHAGVVANGVFASGPDSTLTGRFLGTVDFGAGPVTATSAYSPTTGFVASFDSALQPAWSYSPGPTVSILGARTDRRGRPVLTAHWTGTARFKGRPLLGSGMSVVALDSTGAPVEQRSLVEVTDGPYTELTPVVLDSRGSPVFGMQRLAADSLTLTTFSTRGPSDALLVHLVP
jgi:hypothetical protein